MNQAIHTQNLGLTADSLSASSNNSFILSFYKKIMTTTVSKAEERRFQDPAACRNMEPRQNKRFYFS